MARRVAAGVVLAVAGLALALAARGGALTPLNPKPRMFAVQSIDTMKDSRDRALQMLGNASSAPMIVQEMALIKDAGANYVAIDTPYDAQFQPVLKEWVDAARAAGLSVWFRGNFSGWEGWFGYATITPAQHQRLLAGFLANNAPLFQSGDYFSPCPECENGAIGDPRSTGNPAAYRAFLAAEAASSSDFFARKGLRVTVVPSMNADVAHVLIDAEGTSSARLPILIDHYVAATSSFATTVDALAQENGPIGIGEFGAPIPGINGYMSDNAQGSFVSALLEVLYQRPGAITLVNYWTLRDSSTALSSESLQPNAAYAAVKSYYSAPSVYGRVTDTVGDALSVPIMVGDKAYATTAAGQYQVFLPHAETVQIGGGAYATVTLELGRPDASYERDIVLAPIHPSTLYRILEKIHALMSR